MDEKNSTFSGKPDPKVAGQTGTTGKARHLTSHLTLLEQINNWLSGYLSKIFRATFILTLLFGILLFDFRFSLTGDDSGYVIRASDFIHHFLFPGFRGPLYPIVLSPLIAIFGINPIPLKSLSLLFMLGFLYFIYTAFKYRIPAMLLSALLVLVSINSFILYYASQTYSEAFFMFLEALVFFVFINYFIDEKQKPSFGVQVRRHLILALSILCLGVTRPIGFSAVFAVFVFFILQRHWTDLARFILAFILIITLYQGFKYLLWGNSGFHFIEEGKGMMCKDYYTPALGNENFTGYVGRLAGNSVFFLSSSLYTLLGLRTEAGTSELNSSLTILTYLMLIGSVVLTFRKNKYLLFTGIWVLIFLVSTFIILQTSWGQDRLIIPYFPLMMLMLFAFIYYLSGFKRLRFLSGFLVAIILIELGITLKATIAHVNYARHINSRYYGLTPDWENYCRASEWASKNLPEDAVIACRKPTISFIYGNGWRFFGIGEVRSFPGKSLLQYWHEKGSQLYLISSCSMEKEIPEYLFDVIRNGIVAIGTHVDYTTASEYFRFFIMNFADTLMKKIAGDLKSCHMNPTNNIDSLKVFLNNSKENINIIYPDTLLNILMKANVTHVLEANLRRSASKKNGILINTVERFMENIAIKYPQLLTKVVQIGSDDNEPAWIYKLNYEQYGLKIQK